VGVSAGAHQENLPVCCIPGAALPTCRGRLKKFQQRTHSGTSVGAAATPHFACQRCKHGMASDLRHMDFKHSVFFTLLFETGKLFNAGFSILIF
jgi:hypothetical protein